MLTALVVSGLPTDRFFFEGFLPAKSGARRTRLQAIAGIPGTLILYEAPHRLPEMLADAAEILGERPAVVARELTKLFETVRRGDLPDLARQFAAGGAAEGRDRRPRSARRTAGTPAAGGGRGARRQDRGGARAALDQGCGGARRRRDGASEARRLRARARAGTGERRAVRTAAQRQRAFARGKVAEAKALALLMLKGYRPLARRYAAVGGEIDLIMARGGTIAFVEVKARPQVDVASEAIGARKRERFSRAARAWVARNPWAMSRSLRADAVFVAPRRWPRHVAGAFEMKM